jgi:hypothetical protein
MPIRCTERLPCAGLLLALVLAAAHPRLSDAQCTGSILLTYRNKR